MALQKSAEVRQTSLPDPRVFDALRGPEAWLFVVADGVGGRPGGALASETAVTALVEYLGRAAGCFNQLDADGEHEFLEQLEARGPRRRTGGSPSGTAAAAAGTRRRAGDDAHDGDAGLAAGLHRPRGRQPRVLPAEGAAPAAHPGPDHRRVHGGAPARGPKSRPARRRSAAPW